MCSGIPTPSRGVSTFCLSADSPSSFIHQVFIGDRDKIVYKIEASADFPPGWGPLNDAYDDPGGPPLEDRVQGPPGTELKGGPAKGALKSGGAPVLLCPVCGGPPEGGPSKGGPLEGGPPGGAPLEGGPLEGGPPGGGPLGKGPPGGGLLEGGPSRGGPQGGRYVSCLQRGLQPLVRVQPTQLLIYVYYPFCRQVWEAGAAGITE